MPVPNSLDREQNPMAAILFGSISTIADTSELQRQSYNEAFAAHGLDWSWDRDDYAAMLDQSGGQDRVAGYATSLGQDVDAEAVHQTKSDLFQQHLAEGSVELRAGVLDTVRQAKDAGLKVGLVTTTSDANITSLLGAVADLDRSDFDLIVDSSAVDAPKPDPAAYRFALDQLGEQASDCVAIEDNVGGVRAAMAADLTCVAFPNANTDAHDFDEATRRVDAVDLGAFQQFIDGNQE